jgi:drug/metabolite transporter (DMT)-like permease
VSLALPCNSSRIRHPVLSSSLSFSTLIYENTLVRGYRLTKQILQTIPKMRFWVCTRSVSYVRTTRRLGLDTTEGRAGNWFAMPALASAGVLWGVSFPFGKWALEEMGPAHVTLFRFSLASAALLAYTLLKGAWPGRRDLPPFLLVGILTVPATFLVQFWGLSLTGATVAALIVGCGPPMVAFFAHLFLGERLGKIGWTAVGASTIGVTPAVVRPGASNDWLDDALVLLSLLAVVGWVLLGKRLGDGCQAVPATAWILTFSHRSSA